MSNQKPFFDITIDGKPVGRIVMELFYNDVHKTVDNFKALCTGERGYGTLGKPLHFKGSRFHRIVPGFMCQGGDFTNGNGTGGESIYGKPFTDKILKISKTEPYLLYMANSGPNGSQFFITTVATATTDSLNGRYVVFGKVIEGMGVVKRIEECGSQDGRPKNKVVISNCGLL